MNEFLIFSMMVATVLIVDKFITVLFFTIRECNKNKYEYLKSKEAIEDPFDMNLNEVDIWKEKRLEK